MFRRYEIPATGNCYFGVRIWGEQGRRVRSPDFLLSELARHGEQKTRKFLSHKQDDHAVPGASRFLDTE